MIVQLVNSLRMGGAERIAVNLAINYKQQFENEQVEFIAITDSDKVQLLESMLIKSNIKPLYCSSAPSLYNLKSIIALYRVLKKIVTENKQVIIHVHLFPAQLYISFLSIFFKNVKVVTTEHSNENNRRSKFIFKLLDKWMYLRINKIACITESVKQKLLLQVDNNSKIANKCVVINNGVDLLAINVAPIIENFSTIFLLPANARAMLIVARLVPLKNHQFVVNALQYLPNNYFLFFAGSGLEKENLEKLISKLKLQKQVHFLGDRDDVYSLMKTVDFNILPSTYEGLSGVALESAASGKLFLGSNVNGIKDIIIDQDLLFNIEDPHELANIILNFNSNPILYKQKVSILQNIAAKYSFEEMTQKYYNIYYA